MSRTRNANRALLGSSARVTCSSSGEGSGIREAPCLLSGFEAAHACFPHQQLLVAGRASSARGFGPRGPRLPCAAPTRSDVIPLDQGDSTGSANNTRDELG